MLMQDAATEIVGEVAVSTDDWRQGLRDITALHLQLYARHPWFLDVPLSLETVLMPNNLRVADATHSAMRTLPADDAIKQAVLVSLSTHVHAFGLLHRDLRANDAPDISAETIDLLGQVITTERFPDLAGLPVRRLRRRRPRQQRRHRRLRHRARAGPQWARGEGLSASLIHVMDLMSAIRAASVRMDAGRALADDVGTRPPDGRGAPRTGPPH